MTIDPDTTAAISHPAPGVATPADGSTRVIPLAPGATVEVLLTSGGVRVRGTDEAQLVVRTRDGRSLADAVTIEVAPDRVRIRDAAAEFRLGPIRLSSRRSGDLDLEVPRGTTLAVRSLSGDLDATGIRGSSRWTTASGDLRLAVETGPIAIETMSGDAALTGDGPLAVTARTVSGDLRLTAPLLDGLDLASTSGDIRVEGDLRADGRHVIASVSGDVHLATGSPVRVETRTIAGDVRSTGPNRTEGGRGRRAVVVGAGSTPVEIRTTSGDISVRALSGGAIPMPPPAAPGPDPVMPAPSPAAAVMPARRCHPPRPCRRCRRSRPPRGCRCRRPGPPLRSRPNSRCGPHRPPPAPASAQRPVPSIARRPAWRSSRRWSAATWMSRRRREAWQGSRRPVRAASTGGRDVEDPLEQVLRLVAEGRLTAEEAGRIIAALDGRPSDRPADRPSRREQARREPPGGFGSNPPPGTTPPGPDGFPDGRGASTLRIEVRDQGRLVVNLRLPIAAGRFALDSVPGLSGDQVNRVRDALRSGARGTLLEVDDHGGGVRIVLE